MYPGNQYQMTFYNLLGDESDYTVHHNEPRHPNTTNVHTHGAHLSPEIPGDSVAMVAYPGTNLTYYWNVPCNHFSGTIYWHPHYHGSTGLHVAYGASGPLIIEQDEDWKYEYYEGQPEWLYNMESLVMASHYWDMGYYEDWFDIYNETIDYVTWYNDSDDECVSSSSGGGFPGLRGRTRRRLRTLEKRKQELEYRLSQQQQRGFGFEFKHLHAQLARIDEQLKLERDNYDYDSNYNHKRKLNQLGGDTGADGTWYTINGEYEPTICLTAGEWLKMQILNMNGENTANWYLSSDYIANGTDEELDVTDFCHMYLVAKDGVLIHIDAPRKVEYFFFAPGNRADVIINCVAMTEDERDYWGTDFGSYELYFEDGDGTEIATVTVIGYDTEREFNVTSYTPNRSDYTPDLRNKTDDELTVWKDGSTRYNITIEEDGINGIGFVSVTNYSEQLYINSTAEWIVSNGDGFTHPIHMHVIPFQTINTNVESTAGTGGFDQNNVDDNWHMDGDYYDTFYFAGVIRFQPTTFGGTLVYHCHILHHEDEGAMDVSYLNGGCDAEWNDLDDGSTCYEPACPVYSDYVGTASTTEIIKSTTSMYNGISSTEVDMTTTENVDVDVDGSDSNGGDKFDTAMFVIMLVVILLILGGVGYLLYQNNKLKKQLDEQDMGNVVKSPKSTKI